MKNDNLLGINIPESTDFVNIPELIQNNADVETKAYINTAFADMANFAKTHGLQYQAVKQNNGWRESVTLANGGSLVKLSIKSGSNWNIKTTYKAGATDIGTTNEVNWTKDSNGNWRQEVVK